MTSKWIDDIQTILWKDWDSDGLPWADVYSKLEEIDKLLRLAMISLDDDHLYDKIKNEIDGKPMLTTDNYGEFEDTK